MPSSRSYSAALPMLVTLHLLLSRTESASCCVGYSTRHVSCHRLKRYTIQSMTSTCDINAVIFHTRSGRFICANPSLEWTVKIIQCLNERAQKKS